VVSEQCMLMMHHTVLYISMTIGAKSTSTGALAAKKSKIGWNPDRIKVSSCILLASMMCRQYCAIGQLQNAIEHSKQCSTTHQDAHILP
jgi:hypothetical protein